MIDTCLINVTVAQLQQCAAEAYKLHEASWQPGTKDTDGNYITYGDYTTGLFEACHTVAEKHNLADHVSVYLMRHMCEFPSDYIEELL